MASAIADLPLAVGPAIRVASLMIPSPESDPPFPMPPFPTPLVATLVSSPKSRALSTDLAHRAARSVGASKTVWLAEAVACDLELPAGASASETQAALAALLASEPIDIVVQEADGRRKKILIADMDSTMIDQECIDELAAEIGIKAAGRGDHRALDERRDRLRAGAARTRRAAQGPRHAGDRQDHRAAHHAGRRRRRACRAPCAAMAPGRRWSPGASMSSRRRSPRKSAFRRTAPTGFWKLTAG